MSVFRYLLPTIAAVISFSCPSGVSAQTPDNERDTEALREYTKSKRGISVREKGGDLSLSGDVRFEYQNVSETSEGVLKRGSGTGVANHSFDVEVNLALDYKTDESWGSVQLEFDNSAGASSVPTTQGGNGFSSVGGSGTNNNLVLKRAYAGYNFLEEDAARVDFEVGRRQLYDVFSSKVQFGGVMDGAILRYANSFESVGDFYANGGIWIVDDVVDHYAWALELGLMDLADSGLYAKYSYIDWDKSGRDRTGRKPGDDGIGRHWQSRNSQLTLGYKFQPEVLRTDLTLYGAYLVNHAAKKLIKTDNKKKNKAWYLGARFGKIEYAGDWSLDLNWQHVGVNSILDQDVAGIGRGNYDRKVFSDCTDSTDSLANTANAKGNANYKGYAVEALYALTDNWTWGMEYESSNSSCKKIGGRNSYHKFEVETVYSF